MTPPGGAGAGTEGDDAAPGPDPPGHRPLDARLAIVAGGCWAVTIAGIWTSAAIAAACAVLCGGGGIAAAIVGVRARRARSRRARGRRGRGRRGRGRPSVRVSTACATIAAVLLTACGYSAAVAMRMHAAESGPVHEVYGSAAHAMMTLDDDPSPLSGAGFDGAPRVLVRGTLESLRLRGRDVPSGGSVVVFAPADGWRSLLPGQTVRFRGRFAPPGRRDMTAATIEVSAPPSTVSEPSWTQRTAGSVRRRFAETADAALAPAAAGLLRGVVLGDRSGMDEDARDRFIASGLTHLTAVSGTHFALVCAIVLFLVRPLGPRPAAAITVAVIVGYVILVRPSPSVLRAASMGVIGLAALLTGRRRQGLPALSATVLGLLAWRPGLAVSPGFAMSALATAALVVVAPMWADWLRVRRWPKAAAEAVAVALAAHLATIPIIAGISGSVSTVAVFANLLAVPVVAPVLVPGLLAAGVGPFWQWGAEFLARCAGPPVWWLDHVAQWCSALPAAQVAIPGGRGGGVLVLLAVLGVCAWFASRRFRLCAVAASIAGEAVWLPTHWIGAPW